MSGITRLKPNLQVFVSTRNRLQSLKLTIQSVLHQSLPDFTIIVSDNSTNDETEKFMATQVSKRLLYIRRRTNLGVIEHFNTILSEVTADYFMIFHDDDIMYENMLEELCNFFSGAPGTVAVGSNAFLNVNNKATRKLFQYSSEENLTLRTPGQVARQYLAKGGIVPFPSYLYRKEVATHLRLNPEHGGESCDVAFIMDLTRLGPIIFVARPLMEYSLHEGQVSAKNLFYGQQKLVRYITRQTEIQRTDRDLKRFRIRSIYGEFRDRLLDKRLPLISSRFFLLLRVILKYSPFEYFPRAALISIFVKLHLFGYK